MAGKFKFFTPSLIGLNTSKELLVPTKEVHTKDNQLSRRDLLKKSAGVSVGAGLLIAGSTQSASASMGTFCPPGSTTGGGTGSSGGSGSYGTQDYTGAIPGEGPPTRGVKMLNPRNGETFERNFIVDGQYDQSALEAYNWFARDWRHNDPTNMDPGLLEIIWALTEMLGTTSHWKLNSGYRNPSSNATVGGARQSYHLRGKANDITNPEKTPAAVQGAGKALKRGGLGVYNSFTHVDTGPVRSWG